MQSNLHKRGDRVENLSKSLGFHVEKRPQTMSSRLMFDLTLPDQSRISVELRSPNLNKLPVTWYFADESYAGNDYELFNFLTAQGQFSPAYDDNVLPFKH